MGEHRNVRTLMATALMLTATIVAILPMMADDSNADDVTISVNVVSDNTFTFTAPVSGIWDFGDGSGGRGTTVTHTYSTAGLHFVSFDGSDGSTGLATALVVNRSPVENATVGQVYSYCPGLRYASITSDCPGLDWNSTMRALIGTPTTAGSYTVTVTADGGTVTTFPLNVVLPGHPIVDPSFTAIVSGLTVTVTAMSEGTSGLQYTWRIMDVNDVQKAFGYGAKQTFTLIEPGTYYVQCSVTDSSNTWESTKKITLTEPEPVQPQEPKEIPWAYVILLIVLILALIKVIL